MGKEPSAALIGFLSTRRCCLTGREGQVKYANWLLERRRDSQDFGLTADDALLGWGVEVAGCLFPPRLTCYSRTPTSSSLCPLYVLLGRCSVILSRAGCLYNPRAEI